MDAIIQGAVYCIVRVALGIPLSVAMIRYGVWLDAFSIFDLPSPTWPQTWGIAILIVALA